MNLNSFGFLATSEALEGVRSKRQKRATNKYSQDTHTGCVQWLFMACNDCSDPDQTTLSPSCCLLDTNNLMLISNHSCSTLMTRVNRVKIRNCSRNTGPKNICNDRRLLPQSTARLTTITTINSDD